MGESYSCASGGTIRGGILSGISGDIVVAGDSLTSWTPGWSWGLPLARSPYRMIYNAGVAGNTIQDLINRWSTDVLAKAPAIVMLRIGTNSLALDTTTFRSQYQTLLNSLVSNGIFGIIHAIPQRYDDTTHVALAHNTWLAAQCAAQPTKLKFTNDSIDLVDGSNNIIPAYYSEGASNVHMSGKGMHAQGIRMAADLTAAFAAHDPLIHDGTDTYANTTTSSQYISNPLMAGAGPVATGWTHSVSGSGTAATPSIVAATGGDPNTTPWQRTSIASTGGAGHQVSFNMVMTHPAIAADLSVVKRLDVTLEARLNALDGAAIQTLFVECRDGSNRPAPTLNLSMPADEVLTHTMVVRTSIARGDVNAIVAHAANSINCTFGAIARGAQASAIGSIDFRCVSVRAQGN